MSLVKTLLFLFSCLALLSLAHADNDTQLAKQRQLFQQAKKALQTNQINLFHKFSEQLRDYPLHGYLQYLYLRHRLNQVPTNTIEQFLADENGSFYAERLRQVWLDRLARLQQWQQFLSFYREPQSDESKCYRLQALLATGAETQAFQETPAMWLVPDSQHKACDPVFLRWQQAGLLTEELRWQRLLLALRDNQFSLASYLAKSCKNPEQAQAWVQRWKAIHDNPLSLLQQLPAAAPTDKKRVSLARDEPLSREIILHGIDRLANRAPDKAYATWLRLQDAYQFSEQDKVEVRRNIGTRAALSRDDQALLFFGNIPGGSWQARAAIWQQDWLAAKQAISRLDTEDRTSTKWQYWLGRSLAELGQHQLAEEIWSTITQQRDYYAFLAADRLQQTYRMNHRPIVAEPGQLAALKQQPEIQRLHEFYLLDMMLEARREAYKLKQTRTAEELKLIAVLTHQWGWHNETISLLGKARYWDALDLRFPVLYDSEILQAAQRQGLDPSWLFALARQESAFNPRARSHAGAMGLMQLMPATGKLVSKLINRPLKQVSELYRAERNIELGSAYLRRMYDENQQNPVLATASYNAGPHRVTRWLPDRKLPADIWVENIPFNETRHYVQSVMSYAAIFDSQRNQTIKPLSERMPAIKPETP